MSDLTRKMFLAEVAAVNEHLAEQATDQTPPAEQNAPSPDKIVSEHVTTLHLIGEKLAEVELWMWEHLADVRRAVAMQQAAPTDWIDDHPQLEAIAAAVWEKCGRSDSGTCVEDDPRNIAVAAYAAVLAVLPPPVSRADVLPAWEAVYEPGNVSDYLIGYANHQDAATGMAEAWMRSQAEVTGRLEWVDDEQLVTGHYDRWFELIERHGDGVDTGTGIVVRRRMADGDAHEHVWVTALDGDDQPARDEAGRTWTHCGVCGTRQDEAQP